MAVFEFPYHKVRTIYPDSARRVQLGNSWEFTSAPNAPDQRTFELTFKGMKYFVNSNGTINKTTQKSLNVGALELFYQQHQTWKKFDYPHPVHGTLQVRFAAPLDIPPGIEGGTGVVEDFQIKFIEQP